MNILNESKSNFELNAGSTTYSMSISTAARLIPTAYATHIVRCGILGCNGCIGRKHNLHSVGCPVCDGTLSDLELIDVTNNLTYRCIKCRSVILTCGLGDVKAIFLTAKEFDIEDDAI